MNIRPWIIRIHLAFTFGIGTLFCIFMLLISLTVENYAMAIMSMIMGSFTGYQVMNAIDGNEDERLEETKKVLRHLDKLKQDRRR